MKEYLEMASLKINISKLIAKKTIYLCISFLLLLFIAITGCSKKEERKLSRELNVYNWSSYIGETTIKDFEKEFDLKVNYDNYSSNEELFAKLQTGVAGYDVIFPSDYMVKIMIDQKLLADINIENIPNYRNIDKKFINLPFDPGNKYSIPYQWGTTGLGINISEISENVTNWDILWNEKYKGRITMLNDMRFGLVPALKKSGYSINTTNSTQLEEAKQLMTKQKVLVKAYSSDTYIDMLKSGDAWISYGYSGDIYQVANNNQDVIYVIPQEGTNVWIDNMCIPINAPHKYTAEVFINYILEPKVSAGISNFTSYSSPNREARKYIKPEILNDPGIYPSEEVLEKCEFLQDVGEATKLYDRIWAEIKSK
jgi:spermidine/putrescine transport system substrate-binding protein